VSEYQDVEAADIVGFLEAFLRRDEEAINTMIAVVDPYQLFAAVVGALVQALGEDRLATLVAQLRETRLG
jgi:hypothetical protein